MGIGAQRKGKLEGSPSEKIFSTLYCVQLSMQPEKEVTALAILRESFTNASLLYVLVTLYPTACTEFGAYLELMSTDTTCLQRGNPNFLQLLCGFVCDDSVLASRLSFLKSNQLISDRTRESAAKPIQNPTHFSNFYKELQESIID